MRIKRNDPVVPGEVVLSAFIGVMFFVVGMNVYITNNDLSAFAVLFGIYLFIFITIILPYHMSFGSGSDIIEMNEDGVSLYYKDTLVRQLRWSDITQVLSGYHHVGGKTMILLDREENAIWFYWSKKLISYMLCVYPPIQKKFSTERQTPWRYRSAKEELNERKHKEQRKC